MFMTLLVAFAVSSPDWGWMAPRQKIDPQAVIMGTSRLVPPRGQPVPPLTLRLNVTPPAPGTPYSVVLTFDPRWGWVGNAPANAVAPYPWGGARYLVVPYWNTLGVNRRLSDGTLDPTQFFTRIRCLPPLGTGDHGGGDIMHNAGATYSAGPIPLFNVYGESGVTKGYAFTVTP